MRSKNKKEEVFISAVSQGKKGRWHLANLLPHIHLQRKKKNVSLLKNLESFSVFNSKIQTCRYMMRAHIILKGSSFQSSFKDILIVPWENVRFIKR